MLSPFIDEDTGSIFEVSQSQPDSKGQNTPFPVTTHLMEYYDEGGITSPW